MTIQATLPHRAGFGRQDRLLRTPLGPAFSYAGHRGGTALQRLLASVLAPTGFLWTLIGYGQHASVDQLACRSVSVRQQMHLFFALYCGSLHLLLVHRYLLAPFFGPFQGELAVLS